MRQVGVAELKAHLSEVIDLVKGGQTVVITEHGQPVVRLVWVPPSEAQQLGVRKGILKAPEVGGRLDDEYFKRVRVILEGKP